MTTPLDDSLELGYVARAHGLRGEVVVRLYNAESKALRPGLALSLRPRSGKAVRLVIASTRPLARGMGVRFEGVADRTAAEALCGASVHIARADLDSTGDDEFFLEDIRGFDALDAHGRRLGRVTGFMQTNVVLVVIDGQRGTLFVPVIDAVSFEPHFDERRVVIEAPEGYLDGP